MQEDIPLGNLIDQTHHLRQKIDNSAGYTFSVGKAQVLLREPGIECNRFKVERVELYAMLTASA